MITASQVNAQRNAEVSSWSSRGMGICRRIVKVRRSVLRSVLFCLVNIRPCGQCASGVRTYARLDVL